MNKDYGDILLQAIDTMIQGAQGSQQTLETETFELNKDEDSMLLVAEPFVDMLQVEEYPNPITTTLEGKKIEVQPLWSLTNKTVQFDLLGIEGCITTSPGEDNWEGGSYGIQLVVYGGNKVYTSQFDSSEMLGDIQNFNQMLQKRVFDLTGVSNISYVSIKLYNNTNLQVTFENLRFFIGYNLTKVEDTGVPLQLYSESNDLIYKVNYNNEVYEGKEQALKVKYIYQEDGKYRAVTHLNEDSLPSTAQLLWYRYNPNAVSGDVWGGPYWEKQDNNSFLLKTILNSDLEQERFKVVILNADVANSTVTPIYSNELVFKREKDEAEEYITDLKMQLTDGTGGGYPYYDFDQMLMDKYLHQMPILRHAKVQFSTGYASLDLIKQIKSVTWSWPFRVVDGSFLMSNGLTVVPQERNSGRASRTYFISKEEITEDNAPSILAELFNFTYRIHTFRDAANPSGNIECEIEMIDGVKYSVFNLISLEVPGISGTDYSIIARIINTRGEVKRAITASGAYQLSVSVYNAKGEKIQPKSISAVGYWDGIKLIQNKEYFTLKSRSVDSSPYAVQITCEVSQDAATQKLILEEIIPIPVTTSEDYVYLGPSKVMYSSEGNKPQYDDIPLQLRLEEANISKVSWDLTNDIRCSYTQEGAIVNTVEYKELTPKILEKQYFQPVGVFDRIMTKEPIGIKGSLDGAVQWLQPIILYQNKYFSRVLNNWNGALEINENEDYILASAYVAGGKNEDNTFTGTILGELGTIETGENSSADPDPERTGLFGYKDSVQTFGFKADGTGFIGASGRGRINFDGVNGAIYSGNFDGFNGQPAFVVNDDGEIVKDENGKPTPNLNHPDHLPSGNIGNLPDKLGKKGTYLNLTDGLFITNNGKFRGSITIGGGYSYEGEDGIIELPYETNYTYTSLPYETLVSPGEKITDSETQCTEEMLEKVDSWQEEVPEVKEGQFIWQRTEFKYYNDPDKKEEDPEQTPDAEPEAQEESGSLEEDEKLKPFIKYSYARLTSSSKGVTLYYSAEITNPYNPNGTEKKEEGKETNAPAATPESPPELPTSPKEEEAKNWKSEPGDYQTHWVWSTTRSYIEELDKGNIVKQKYVYSMPKLENSESDQVAWCIRNGMTTINGSKITTGSVLAQRLSAEMLTSLGAEAPKSIEGEEMPFATQGTIFNLQQGTIQTKNFKIDKDGNATFKGHVEAESGKISKWNIVDSGIWYDDSDEELTYTSDLYFGTGKSFKYVQNSTAWPKTVSLSLKIKNNFGISSGDGTVYARGKIMATSGEIGSGGTKWIIGGTEGGNSYIYSGSNSIASDGGIPSVDVNSIYIGTDGISCSSTTEYDTVIKSGLITTIYKGNSATYIRPDGIYFSYSQSGDFSNSNPASSNVLGSLTRYGTAVNLQLKGYITGATSITATGNITTTGNITATGNIYGIVGSSTNKQDVYADDIYANYINNTVRVYNPNVMEYQSLSDYIKSIASLDYVTKSDFESLQKRVTTLERVV